MTTVTRDGEYTPPGRARANGVFLCLVLFCCQAVKTVDPKKATGKLHKLWMDFAKFYEGHGDVANARVIYEKATLVAYRYVQERRGSWGGGAGHNRTYVHVPRVCSVGCNILNYKRVCTGRCCLPGYLRCG